MGICMEQGTGKRAAGPLFDYPLLDGPINDSVWHDMFKKAFYKPG